MRQSGTFTRCLPGKFLPCVPSVPSERGLIQARSRPQYERTTVCEYDVLYSKVHAYWHPWVTASGVGFSAGKTSQIHRVSVQRTKAQEHSFFHQVSLGKEEGYTFISEPPQCWLFRNQEKRLIWILTALQISCYPKGFERVSYGETPSQPQEQKIKYYIYQMASWKLFKAEGDEVFPHIFKIPNCSLFFPCCNSIQKIYAK